PERPAEGHGPLLGPPVGPADHRDAADGRAHLPALRGARPLPGVHADSAVRGLRAVPLPVPGPPARPGRPAGRRPLRRPAAVDRRRALGHLLRAPDGPRPALTNRGEPRAAIVSSCTFARWLRCGRRRGSRPGRPAASRAAGRARPPPVATPAAPGPGSRETPGARPAPAVARPPCPD